MKKLIYLSICICLLLIISACREVNLTNSENNNSKKEYYPTLLYVKENKVGKKYYIKFVEDAKDKAEEKHYPKFMDVETGKQALKPLVFGSIGWSYPYYREQFLFTTTGGYLLRYNINKNEVDRVVYLGEGYNGWPYEFSFSSNGRYSIVSNFSFSGGLNRNYFLIDFEENTVELICDIYSEDKVAEIINNRIPKEVKREVNKYLMFDLSESATCCSIEETASTTEPYNYLYTFHDKNGNTSNLYSLKNLSCGSYSIIDENRVAAIMSPEGIGCDLGYFKIAIIDVKEDKIIQEYFLNKK
jgi:hypothetical protein